jgi:DnaK suppressor protein
MDLPTQAHLTTLRELLAYRLRELNADLHAAQQARQGGADPAPVEVADRKDDAARSQAQGVDAVQEQRDLDELVLVQAALHRLDDGSYGDCLQCGEPIALQRLLVLPAAQRCAHCQAAAEHAGSAPAAR